MQLQILWLSVKDMLPININKKSPEGFLVEVVAKDSAPSLHSQETEFDETQNSRK